MAGCASIEPISSFTPDDLSVSGYTRKVDNFVVVLDGSRSMIYNYEGRQKVTHAKDVANRLNKTIPSDLRLTGGLRVFGPVARIFNISTALFYGMTDYSKAGFDGGLNKVKSATGHTPLELSIDAASGDLEPTKGQSAVIIISDAVDQDDGPVAATERMKAKYGDRVCIYPVFIGDDPNGRKVMERIAKAGECGFATDGADILPSQAMADYVVKVFLHRGETPPPPATPGFVERVPVEKVVTPPPPPPAIPAFVEKEPVEKVVPPPPPAIPDSDGDGVKDNLDECPGTPKGATVNEVGCWILKGVNFDTAKWDIKPRYYPLLDGVVSILEKNPDMRLSIHGHTDIRGTGKYNRTLSKNRADSVKGYFVSKGIDEERLKTVGFWFTRPVATNDTPEGRAKNRRVELKPVR